MKLSDVQKRLQAPFPAHLVGWKPQSFTKDRSRALLLAYVDARDVQDRLDRVCGIGGWRTEYVQVGPHSVECRLSLRLGDEWVTKADVGSTSDQPDEGDRLKAAYSDGFKRAAVAWGIGRYLYRLDAVWADYDPVKKKFTGTPDLPAWAKPAPKAAPKPAHA